MGFTRVKCKICDDDSHVCAYIENGTIELLTTDNGCNNYNGRDCDVSLSIHITDRKGTFKVHVMSYSRVLEIPSYDTYDEVNIDELADTLVRLLVTLNNHIFYYDDSSRLAQDDDEFYYQDINMTDELREVIGSSTEVNPSVYRQMEAITTISILMVAGGHLTH